MKIIFNEGGRYLTFAVIPGQYSNGGRVLFYLYLLGLRWSKVL